MKIGITPGHTNGVGYELILKAFENPTTLELCVPVVYGNSKAALFNRREMELGTNFITLQSLEEVQKERLCILDVLQGEVPVSFGQDSAEATRQADLCAQAALKDCQEELTDAVVLGPTVTPVACPADSMEMLVSDNIRIAVSKSAEPMQDIQTLSRIMERDFGIKRARIALVTNDGKGDETLGQQADEQKICICGPYPADRFLEDQMYRHFDVVLMAAPLAESTFKPLSAEYGIRYFAGGQLIVATPRHDAQLRQAGKGTADPASLLHCLWLVSDVACHRGFYDEITASPLPKLFHDKREDRRVPATMVVE